MKPERTYLAETPMSGPTLTRLEFLELKLELRVLRIRHLWRKYSVDQPRVPAGSPDGGQWTSSDQGSPDTPATPASLLDELADIFDLDSEDLFDGEGEDELVQEAQTGPFRWTPGRVTSRITGRMMEGTPAQFTQFAVTNAQAETATREVWRVDPSWRPPSGLSETIEGEIRDAEYRLEAATTRLRELGDPAVREVATRTCLMPNGNWVGQQLNPREESLRTVTRSEFNTVLGSLLNGSNPTSSPGRYEGLAFERGDGTTFGVRMSNKSDLSIDILRSVSPSISNKIKVHYK